MGIAGTAGILPAGASLIGGGRVKSAASHQKVRAGRPRSKRVARLSRVMAALVAAISVREADTLPIEMAGTRPAMTR